MQKNFLVILAGVQNPLLSLRALAKQSSSEKFSAFTLIKCEDSGRIEGGNNENSIF